MLSATDFLVLASMMAIAQAPPRQTPTPAATIVDVSGTETKLTGVTTDRFFFADIKMGSSGIPIVMQEFRVGLSHAEYRRWVYLDELEHIEIKQGSPTTVATRLRTGVTVSGSFGKDEFVVFRGESEFGDLSLDYRKVRSITITAPSDRRQPDVLGTHGVGATITLRDGTILVAYGVQRRSFFRSNYIGERGHSEHYGSIWITYKRGEAAVERELAVEQVKEIVFDTPAVTSTSGSGPTLCKVTLRDGTTLSGDCEGTGRAREFDTLVGRTDGVVFELFGDLAYAIKKIEFSQ